MLRALRDVIDAAARASRCAPACNRGHVFTGDIGSPSTAHLRRHGRHRQSRRPAGRPGRRSRDPGHRGRARCRANALRQRARAAAREGQGARGHGSPRRPRPQGCAEPAPGDEMPLVSREREVAVLGEALDAARTACSSSSSRSSASRGWASRASSPAARTHAVGFAEVSLAGEQYARTVPYCAWRNALRQLVGITPERSREEAGAQLAPFVTATMPDLAAVAAAPRDCPSTPRWRRRRRSTRSTPRRVTSGCRRP